MISKSCKNFIRWQSVAGVLSILAVVLGTVAAATGLGSWYALIREPVLSVSFGAASMGKPVVSWINQILATVVLLVIGLECKRAFMERELIGPDRLWLPAIGAVGGLLASAAVYLGVAGRGPGMGSGWVAPLGTDMALGLAVLAWLGERVPDALKSFFVSISVFTLLGSAAIAAAVQESLPVWSVLGLAGACLTLLAAMSLSRVESISAYLAVGAGLWAVLVETGALAVLAGPLTALFIPVRNREQTGSPLVGLEQDLLPTVCCMVVPLLAMANAGFFPQGASGASVMAPQTLGMLLSLFPAKAAGIFGICWIGVRLRLCALPAGVGWKEFGGAVLLGGAGFTVNVFLGTFAVAPGGAAANEIRLAALAASALSLASGYFVLRYALARRRNKVIQRI